MKRLELYIDGKLEATEELRKVYPGPAVRSLDGDYYHRAYMKLARYGRASGKPYELYLICPAKKVGQEGKGMVIDRNMRRCHNPGIVSVGVEFTETGYRVAERVRG